MPNGYDIEYIDYSPDPVVRIEPLTVFTADPPLPDSLPGSDPNNVSLSDTLRPGSYLGSYSGGFVEGDRQYSGYSDILRSTMPGASGGGVDATEGSVLGIIRTLGEAASRTVQAIMASPRMLRTPTSQQQAPWGRGTLFPPLRSVFPSIGTGFFSNPASLIALVLVIVGGALILRRA